MFRRRRSNKQQATTTTTTTEAEAEADEEETIIIVKKDYRPFVKKGPIMGKDIILECVVYIIIYKLIQSD